MLPTRLACLFAGLFVACGPAGDPPPSILLLTLDTTTPEALGCYGAQGDLTPNLDRLAREGILFENARAVTPLTLPSHGSILTGLYPPRHGLRRNGETRLPGEARTLAERARDEGYRTAAFVSAVVLVPEFGLDQGFELYDAPAEPENVQEHLSASRSASEVAAGARAWLAELEDERPFFLWLHFYDPHFPYSPPAEALARAKGDAYLGEVSAMDAAIGDVLAELEGDERLARTLIVAVADHGEGHGRHGEETHGAFVFDSTLRIPMIVRLPEAARAGERVERAVSQVDVIPLVAGVLGWPKSGELDGSDPLLPEGEPGAYFESYFGTKSFGWSPITGWTDGRLKFMHSSAPELYDVGSDPGEEHNVLTARAPEAEAMRGRIAELSGRSRLPRSTLDEGQESLQREIERLGYAGTGDGADEEDPEPLAASTAPSPHRMVGAYSDYMAGRKLYEEKGSREEAAVLLERAVGANPQNHKAWFTLGLARQDLQRFEEAANAFRMVLSMPGGERIPAQLNLAVSLYNLGLRDDAVRELEGALSDTPGPPGALELLAQLLEESGRLEDAKRARARALARQGLRPGG